MNQICCQKCRGMISYNLLQCPHCGWDQRTPYLPDTSELHKTFIPIHDPQAISLSEYRCPTCGAVRNVEYSDGRTFCAICGEDISGILAGRKKALIRIIASVVTVCLAASFLMVYQTMKSKGEIQRQQQEISPSDGSISIFVR